MNSEITGSSASSVLLTGPQAAREIAAQLENLWCLVISDDKQALPEVSRRLSFIKMRKSHCESL